MPLSDTMVDFGARLAVDLAAVTALVRGVYYRLYRRVAITGRRAARGW